MTDEQQIETLQNDLEEALEWDVSDHDTVDIFMTAINLTKQGYRKIPENAVVLTQEEYDNMFTFKTTRGGFYSILNTIRKAQRQETAKEWREKMTTILLTLFKRGWTSTEEHNLWITEINEFAKQYGVEI